MWLSTIQIIYLLIRLSRQNQDMPCASRHLADGCRHLSELLLALIIILLYKFHEVLFTVRL